MKRNVASQVIQVEMIKASDGTAFAGTVAVVLSKDGAAQAASGGTGPTLLANGSYKYVPTAAETDYAHIAFTFTGTGAIPAMVQVYPTFPQTGDNFARIGALGAGLTNVQLAATQTKATAFSAGLTINSTTGNALTLTSTGGDGAGMIVTGNGTGSGIRTTGGATGNGILTQGGGTSGHGIRARSQGGTGTGIRGEGFATAAGIEGIGGATGAGILGTGGTNGDGIKGALGGTGVDIRGNITGNITGTLATVTNVTNERGKYSLGAVWIGPTANTNTVSYVDGVVTNPVSTVAAAKTIADALNIRRFHTIRTGATQIGAAMTGYAFDGTAWSCVTTGGSRDVGTSSFNDAKVTAGTFAGTTGLISWHGCEFSTGVSVGISFMQRCTFAGTTTLLEAGNYHFMDCASNIPGATAPVFAVPSGTVNIGFRRWSGGIHITGITTGTTISIDIVSGGSVTLEGADGTVNIRGIISSITDSRTGSPVLNDGAALNASTISDGVWEEAIADHSGTAGSTAEALNAAGGAGDPWTTTLPGSYTGSQAGKMLSDIIDDTSELQADDVPGLIATLDAVVDTVKAETALILTDTGTTLDGKLNTIDGIVDNILIDTAEIGAAGANLTDLGGMSTAMKAEVNAEVVDTLNTDTYAEPGQGAPGATVTLAAKINYLYKAWRNRSTQNATTYSLYNNAETVVDQKATVSDNGTVATKELTGSGP